MPPANHTSRATRVLVFPCGTEIGLELHRALGRCRHVALYGASSVFSNHGRYLYDPYWDGFPFITDPACIPALNALIEAHEIDLLYPAHDDVVTALADNPTLQCPMIGSPASTTTTCRSKRKTYAHLRGLVPVPQEFHPAESYPLPVFLKPEAGQGSHGVMLAHSRAQVEAMRERDPSLMLLEYLPGAEYTVDCFTDATGTLRFAGPRERLRILNGISVHSKPLLSPELEKFAYIINEALPLRGAWFFQMKRNRSGALTLLEVAPRVGGGMGLFRAVGVNLPLLSVYDALGMSVRVDAQDFAVDMDRALHASFRLGITYEHVYIDFDDTLSCGGLPSPLAAAFLAQCRVRGVKVHVLSRHAGNLEAALAASGLRGLVDSVMHIADNSPKSAHVRKEAAIFIDDSFAERAEVRAALGIPVFGVDALDVLMDWSA